MTEGAKFQLPALLQNANGWGPPQPENSEPMKPFVDMPFQLFNKCDRVGRIVDWLGVDRYKKNDTRERYNERMYGSSQNAGSQFDYIHDNEEANFQLVDSSKPQKPQRTFRRTQVPFVSPLRANVHLLFSANSCKRTRNVGTSSTSTRATRSSAVLPSRCPLIVSNLS